MLFVLFYLVVVQANFFLQNSLEFCLPDTYQNWDKNDIYTDIDKCLNDNNIFKHRDLTNYTSSFIHFLDQTNRRKIASENVTQRQDLLLQYMDEVQLKSTHHMEGLKKCSKLGKVLPNDILRTYTNEAALLDKNGAVWTYKLNKDIDFCKQRLQDIVTLQMYHKQELQQKLQNVHDAKRNMDESSKHEIDAFQAMLQNRSTFIHTIIQNYT